LGGRLILPFKYAAWCVITGPPLPVAALARASTTSRLTQHHSRPNLGSLVTRPAAFTPGPIFRPLAVHSCRLCLHKNVVVCNLVDLVVV